MPAALAPAEKGGWPAAPPPQRPLHPRGRRATGGSAWREECHKQPEPPHCQTSQLQESSRGISKPASSYSLPFLLRCAVVDRTAAPPLALGRETLWRRRWGWPAPPPLGVSAIRHVATSQLRGSANQLSARRNPPGRGRMHQHESDAKEHPRDGSGCSDSEHRRDGEYCEVEHGDHGVPPEMRTSEWQLAYQSQCIENKGFTWVEWTRPRGLVRTLCRD